MSPHPAVQARLDRLAPDQRAAATAPPGPVLCVAPAGSGKTTTLVARIAWLIDRGEDPASVCAITFNRRAAEELQQRLDAALAPLGGDVAGSVRVRTFHALGREILVSAGRPVEPLVDRLSVCREITPDLGPAGWRRLDDAFSRLKLDLSVGADEIAADPAAGPVARAFVAYESALAARDGLDFDDLLVRALRELEAGPELLERWRERCRHLLVDEVQDVDRSQLRLALLLAAPSNRVFLVGDDDQSIYGWRLADVRRVLALAERLPDLRRVDLVTNYRCPASVVERSVRLVSHNSERFAKRIVARPGAAGRLVLAPDTADDAGRARHVLASWPEDDSSRAILARTNRELLPAVAVALETGVPFRAPRLPMLLESSHVDALLAAAADTPPDRPLLARLAVVREATSRPGADEPTDHPAAPGADRDDAGDPFRASEVAAALLAWAAPFRDLATFTAAVHERRGRLMALRRPDAALSLATAHTTKGLEFDHVAVLDMDEARFPSARSIGEAADPERALEEERRLAYVAWTRARRTLTLVYDPAAPSAFLLEAFAADEIGCTSTIPA